MPHGKRNKKKNRKRSKISSWEQHQENQSQQDSKQPESNLCQRNIDAPSVSRGILSSTSLARSTASDLLLYTPFTVSDNHEVSSKKDSSCDYSNQEQIKADDKLLLNAIESASSHRALELLKEGHRFSSDGLDRSLLMACLCGHKYLAQTIVSIGASVQCRDIHGNTPLLICADKGFTDIVRFLLTRKADVNAVNSAGDTALILSIHSWGSAELVKVLLEQKEININHQNQDGYTALMKAVEVKDIHTIKILLEAPHNVDYWERSRGRDYALDLACVLINSIGQTAQDIAETSGLGNVFGILNRCRHSRTSPLVLAAEECDTESFNILLNCLFLDTDDMERSVREVFRKMFDNCRSKNVKTFNDNEIMMIDRLIKCGADVNTGSYYCCPLSVAVETGNYRLVELLCKNGAQLNQHSYGRESGPLQIAAKTGRCDLVELLLSYQTDINQNRFSGSVLDCALSHGQIDCAKRLIQLGATLDIKHALISAVDHQLPEYMSFLFDSYKQDVLNYFLEKTENGPNLLISAVNGGNIEIIRQILDAGVDINQPTNNGVTPLSESKKGEVAQLLIQRGADVNQNIDSKQYGRIIDTDRSITPVIHILETKYKYDTPTVELVKVLLENGAAISGRDATDRTAVLVVAEKEGSVDMLQVLLDHGADLSDRDKKGNTALILAVLEDCSQNVSLLLHFTKNKDFINAQNHEGKTALMYAITQRNHDIITDLITLGADVNVADVDGNTALMYALNESLRSDRILLTTLISAGSDVNHQNIKGLSPLMLAASKNIKDALQILLDSGADVNAVSKSDPTKTALSCLLDDCSYLRENIKCCIEYLLERGASASYVCPLALVKIILSGFIDVIPKMIERGLGPADIESDKIPGRVVETGMVFRVSPLCMALLVGNVGLARYFEGNLFLTNSDVSSLTCNKDLRQLLERKNQHECLNFLDEMSSQPLTLFKLSFVAVSSAVGTSSGRENRVNLLPLPHAMKYKLLFKTEEVSLTIPTSDKTGPLASQIVNIRNYIYNMSLGNYVTVDDFFPSEYYEDSDDDSSTEYGWYSHDYDDYDTD